MPNSNQPQTAISATVPTFADDFSNTIIAYLEQKKGGARDRVNKALKDKSLFPVTRLFNEMVSISPQVLSVEYNNFMEAEDAEDYSMQVVRAAARTIFNEDFTDLKPEIAAKFSNLSKLKKLCEKENTTIVDMLLKGISALHSQCLADALTAHVSKGSARDRTEEDEKKIEKIQSILAPLQKLQIDITRESLLLPSGAKVELDVNPIELRHSLNDALKEIDDSKSVIEENARTKFDLNQDQIGEMITDPDKMVIYLKQFKDVGYVERDNLLKTYKNLNNMRGDLEAGIAMVDMSQSTEMILTAQHKLDEYRSSLTESDMTSELDEQKSPEKPQVKAKSFLKSSQKEYQIGLTRLGAMKTAHKNAKDFETKSGIETKYNELYERLNAIEGLPTANKIKLNAQYSPKFELFQQSFENNVFKFLQKEYVFKGTENKFSRFHDHKDDKGVLQPGDKSVLSRFFDDFVMSDEVRQDILNRLNEWQGDEENHLKDLILKTAQKSGLFNPTLTDLSPAGKQFFANKLDFTKKFGTQQAAEGLFVAIKACYYQNILKHKKSESLERWLPLLNQRLNLITQENVFTKRDHYIATIIPSTKDQEASLKSRLSNLEQSLQEDFQASQYQSAEPVNYIGTNLHQVGGWGANLDLGLPIDLALLNETLLKCGLDKALREINDAIEGLETYKEVLNKYGVMNVEAVCEQIDNTINTLQIQQSVVKECALNLPGQDLKKTLEDTASIFTNVQNAVSEIPIPIQPTSSGIIKKLKQALKQAFAEVIEFINSCFGLGTKAVIKDLNENKQAIINTMKQMKDELRSMRLETPKQTQSISSELSQTAEESASKIAMRSITSSKTTEEDVISEKPGFRR